MVSGQVDDEEGVNVLNVRIWVESYVLEYEPRCIAKKTGKFRIRIGTQGGRPDTETKKILCWKKYEGEVWGVPIQRMMLMCWLKAGER